MERGYPEEDREKERDIGRESGPVFLLRSQPSVSEHCSKCMFANG